MTRATTKGSRTQKPRASKRKAADEEKVQMPAKPRTSKRKAPSDDDDEATDKPRDDTAKPTEGSSSWGFMKAPTGSQLKKQKKAAQSSEDAEFPPISDADKAVFDNLVPPTTSGNDNIRILAWNVNGLRAVLKNENYFRAYIAREDPDVLCLSETKIDDASLGQVKRILPQYPHQYWSCADKKGYSGTAVFSKVEPLSVRTTLAVDKMDDDEGRYVALEFDSFWLVHTYVPNSGQKLDRLNFRTELWDPTLFANLRELDQAKPVVWCGDLNVAHEEIDIHDPKGNRRSAGFTDEERGSFGKFLATGFVDSFRHLNAGVQAYSYFSYRFGARAKNKGWRLDYFVVSAKLMDRVEESAIRSAIQGSDHLPIALVLKK